MDRREFLERFVFVRKCGGCGEILPYEQSKEALCIVTGSDSSKWTAILEQSACGNAKTEAEIEAYLEQEFKPAYECAYNNNPLIVGVQMDIDTINGNIDAFNRMRRDDDRQYSYCEFWIDGEYDLYYFDQETLRYEKNGVNLLHQLGISEDSLAGLSLAEKNRIFIEARVARFKAEAENYFCKDDAIYQLVFLYMIGASDNGEKNMYPYKMDTLASGSRWRFLQDDLDSIFSTDNQGQDTKSYSVELHDFTDDTKSAYVFKGEDSALWQLVELAWPNECKQMGRDILQAMYDLSSKGTKTTDKLMGFFEDYFFARAQEYFTPSAYNNDTEYSYEEAWNNKEYVASVDIHPLAQALGAHLTTERAWVQKRIVYLMSKYGFGGYASNEDTALGIISVRTQTAQGFTLTPAIDSYPTILGGQSQSSSAIERVKAGEPVALAPVGGGNTNTYIVGADFLSDIGDLKDLDIDPSSVVTLSVASKRLRRLKVGDETPEEVTSHLATLAIQRCDSLETVDARNLTTLVGTVDLSQCPRLTEALFDGTNATAVIIAAGSKIEKLHLPDSVSTLDLRDTKFLSDFEIGTLANLRFLRLEGAPIVNGFAMLKEAYNTDGQQLKDIRLVGFEYDGTADDLEMIANLANDLDKDGNPHLYNGIDAMGNPTEGNPILEGKLNIDGYVYEESANVVKQQYPTIEFTPKGYYVKFADPVVQQICAQNWGDGVGITEEQAAAVTSIGTIFQGNTEITSFEELELFQSVGSLASKCFNRCGNLQKIKFPTSVKSIGTWAFSTCASLDNIILNDGVSIIDTGAFNGCTALSNIYIPKGITNIAAQAFNGTTNLRSIIFREGLKQIGNDCFRYGSLENIELPEGLTTIGNYAFGSKLKAVVIPSTVTSIGQNAFYQCKIENEITLPQGLTAIQNNLFFGNSIPLVNIQGEITSIGQGAFRYCNLLSVVLLPNTTTPPTLGADAFSNTSSNLKIYVPDQSLTAYQEATGWIDYADRIMPMSLYGKDVVTFADPAVEAICKANFDTDGNGYITMDDLEKVTSIGEVFRGNTEITSFDEFELFNNVSVLQSSAFNGCTNLRSTTPPVGLSELKDRVFFQCSSLESIRIPKGVQTIYESTFYKCLALEVVTFDEGSQLSTIGRTAFYECTKLASITLPSTVTNFGNQVFSGCAALQTINIPAGVTDISTNLFYSCSALVNVNVANGAKFNTIGGQAFFACTKLASFDAMDGVVNIGSGAFQNCSSFTKFTIPSSVTEIGRVAFYGCTSLRAVMCHAVSPPTMGDKVFDSTNNCPIYVPDASVEAYKTATNWSTYASRIKPLSEYTE